MGRIRAAFQLLLTCRCAGAPGTVAAAEPAGNMPGTDASIHAILAGRHDVAELPVRLMGRLCTAFPVAKAPDLNDDPENALSSGHLSRVVVN